MKTVIILAAGRGERLKPITNTIPKALCKIHGIPLIEYHLHHLAAAGFNRIIINHAYLGGKIRQHLGTGGRWGVEIEYSPEPPGGLETGGGIVNALPLLGSHPFAALNADIYTDYPLAQLALPAHSQAHIVLVNNPAHNRTGDFSLEGSVLRNKMEFTFSGIALYDPRVFNDCKPGRYPVSPLLRQLAHQGRATGELYAGHWYDIGSPERLAALNA